MHYIPHDKYFDQAKQMGYRARSVFKLQEIQNRFKFIKQGDRVLDLGAAPGSFIQLIEKIVGERGFVIGVDLKPIKPFKKPNIKCYEGNIFDDIPQNGTKTKGQSQNIFQRIIKDTGIVQFDVITSDLAPFTSGIKFLDAGRSFELNVQVLKIAETHLKKGGNVLLKTFPGEDQSKLIALVKKQFSGFKIAKPQAVRGGSREVYVVGLGKV